MTLLIILLGAVSLGTILMIFSTLRLGISPMPSSAAARQKTIRFIQELRTPGDIVDIGSGWGGLARQTAFAFPDRRIYGIEASPVPFLFSMCVGKLFGPRNLYFRLGNFLKEPFPLRDRIYICYLAPGIMKDLSEKIGREGFPGPLISIVFSLPGRTPAAAAELHDLMHSTVYLYRQ